MTTLTEVTRKSRWAWKLWRPGPLWLALPGIVFLLLFLIIPSLKIFMLSVVNNQGQFSLAGFERFFTHGVYQRVLMNTFDIAFWTTVFSLLLGYPLAYWLSNLPERAQKILSLLILLAFWSSTLVKNFTWLILLARNGVVAHLLSALGFSGDSLLFNRGVVIFAMVHTLLPLGVVTLLPVMNQIDRNLQKAAATLGADRAHTFWRVYFTLSMRGVAAAGLLIFISSLGFFITPTFLGSPREMMLGQMIILQINQLQNWQLGCALAVILVLAAIINCIIYDLIFGLSSLAGGSNRNVSFHHRILRRLGLGLISVLACCSAVLDKLYQRGPGRWLKMSLLSAFCWVLIALLVLPVLAVIPISFTDSNFLSFPPHGFSLKWYQVYFDSPLWMGATLRSFMIGLAVALVSTVIAGMAAFSISRSDSRASGLVFLLFILPMIIPAIVIAIVLFYLCAQIGLVATDLGIAIGHIVIALPMVFVILLTTFRGHDWRLDQAAATLGANKRQVLWRVTLPSIKAGLAAALVIGFLNSFEELTIALFIGGGLKTTLPKQMWDDILLQITPTLAAASTVVLLVVGLFFVLLQWARPGVRPA
ncbi:ABC transporter permease subunit [Gibbsiella dentisursi]|uniref:ABC transporter permease subunit n=1 Tax=Gibbsiella dentisursi TaxID=796890 RepID=A0ABP7KM85_9GAMM